MDVNKLLNWVNEHDIKRHANLIIVTDRKTHKVVHVFHSGTTEESERQLQAFLEAI